MSLPGRATAEGTARFAARLTQGAIALHPTHFNAAFGLVVSSVGYGTGGNEPPAAADSFCQQLVAEAVRRGCNVLDTAPSGRADHGENALGQAVADLVAQGACTRDELVVMAKGGFIVQPPTRSQANPVEYIYEQFIAPGIFEPEDLAGGIHCLAPNFLSQQIAWSLRALRLRTIDVYFVQNPEMQLAFVDRATFRRRLQLAFARLEEEVSAGRIGSYGVSTWEGVRRPPVMPGYLGLKELQQLASAVAGPHHHLRALQLPISPRMVEAATLRNQPAGEKVRTALKAAQDLGLPVVASAALGQGPLPSRVAEALAEAFGEIATPQQRALQFVRSLPGVATALFSSGQADHVRENLAVAQHTLAPAHALQAARLLAR